MYNVICFGLDYLRYKVFAQIDVDFIAQRIPYVSIHSTWLHGERFVDLTGGMLEIIRMMESLSDLAQELALVFPLSRIDAFVDIEGDVLADVESTGTTISNGGRVETIYSTHLKDRGNVTRFCRAYDAMAAGHYTIPVTRFECEFKRVVAHRMLTPDGWKVNPIGAMLHTVKLLLGVDITIETIDAVDFDAPRRRLAHSRERFYARYGKNILNDMQDMGLQGLRQFVIECQGRMDDGKDKNGKSGCSATFRGNNLV